MWRTLKDEACLTRNLKSPGQPLRAQNTKAAPCAPPQRRERKQVFVSTKTATQPITAKQDIPAIKVSRAENVKRRSLPHAEPRKPGQPLRAQNTKAAPCAHPAVRKKAGPSVSTKAAAQPITAKQDIPAIKVSHVENVKKDEACLTQILESRASHFAHKTRRPRRAPTQR
ncbi:hypothetical protein MRX96_002532 [Rhipicephalus microplus]